VESDSDCEMDLSSPVMHQWLLSFECCWVIRAVY